MYGMTKIALIISIGPFTLWAGGIGGLDTPELWMDITWLTWTVGVTAVLLFMIIAFVFSVMFVLALYK